MAKKKSALDAQTTAAALFLIIAILHLWRVLAEWPATINNLAIPVSISWIAVVVACGMSYWLWKSRK